MKLSELKDKKLAFWGLGQDNGPLLKEIIKRFPTKQITIFYDQLPKNLPVDAKENNLDLVAGTDIKQKYLEFDVIIKSPGVSIYRDEFQNALKQGIIVSSATEIWFAENKDVPKIVISGTKGKSTTATLIQQLLAALNLKVILAGNIGTALWSIDSKLSATADFIVIELSSYQLAGFCPESKIAILTSLYEEHLDWHRSKQQYYRDKLNIFSNSDLALAATQCKNEIFSLNLQNLPKITFFNPGTASSEAAITKLIQDSAWPWCKSAAQMNCLLAACLVINSLGFTLEDLKKSLLQCRSFSGLAHRQEYLGKIGEYHFIDDSISTIPAATLNAIDACEHKPVTILVGGYDRGLDYENFAAELLAHTAISHIICLPTSGNRLHAILKEKMSLLNQDKTISFAQNLDAAIKLAIEKADPNSTILLSPAAPSYDHYSNFAERGLAFQKAAFKIKD